jgi:mono/diheme cytochrome c family protein
MHAFQSPRIRFKFALALVCLMAPSLAAAEGDAFVPSAERGYELLTHKAFLPPDFDQQVFDELWRLWPAALREQARNATPAERRKMAFSRYGLIESPDHPGEGTALGYLSDGQGGWVMNCLACHGGKVAGRVIPGLPNSHFALQTLTEEVRLTKLAQAKKLSHMDLGMIKIPLGSTDGTTNSVAFGVALEALRDADMNVHLDYPVPPILHHDLDAPPFWNVRKKTRLYYDGLVKKGHRPLIQFVMLPRNDAAVLKSWENDFRDILAWIESVEPPKYPWPVDKPLAAQGRLLFEQKCASCHGTYGENSSYPNRIVDLDKLGTDPLRLRALSDEHRANFQHGWLGGYNTDEPVFLPTGYLAPPLDGIWASAPYLHNGSVPTLWHLLHPDERPVVWTRTEEGYDQTLVGLEATTFENVPKTKSAAERRRYFDTRQPGKSAAGHLFPNELDDEQKRAVLEYLKTL